MAYVQQICDGYNKKSLMGNWFQQRLYPKQPFRQEIIKQARSKDEGITCLDGTGFQRALPRIERRNKWETTNRVVLDQGFKPQPSVTRAEFPHHEAQSSIAQMKRPFDKNSQYVLGTSTHPHSQNKPIQASYHIVNQSNCEEIKNQRNVSMTGTAFKSTLPQHAQMRSFVNYTSQYKGKYPLNGANDAKTRTQSQFNKTRSAAGSFKQVYNEQTVKPITTLYCEKNKQQGDEKEITGIQRSWVPPRDKAVSYSMGKTAEEFRKAGKPANDIQTSLNMNIGVHNIHPKNVEDNYFRHARSITVQHNNTLCSRP